MAWLLLMVAAVMFSACEKTIFSEENGREEGANVVVVFSSYGQQDFTRAALADECTRLTVAVFNADGTKVKNVVQQSDDEGFGMVALSLQEGVYSIVAVAHSSTEGNASVSSPEKVTFASNKVTDTFSVYGTLTVGDEPINRTMTMRRVVSMFRMTTSGNIPTTVERLKFYYTGGSSTLNPMTGYGCVNSKQTEYRDVRDDGGNAVNVYEIYTFPHAESDTLKLTVTALTNNDVQTGERVMDDIPVVQNKITTWNGSLFGGGGGASQYGSLTVDIDNEWTGTITY